jgi:hypothetical protein
MTMLLHHIPIKSEMAKDAGGYWCLDGWKISHIQHTAQDIKDKWGISMILLQNEEVFCSSQGEWVRVNIDLQDRRFIMILKLCKLLHQDY